MMISPQHYQDMEIELRKHLDAGTSLGDALRLMHCECQVGLMLLWPAVMAIRQVDKLEAMRIVVHESASGNGEGGVSQ
ncbi:MAG: hypothetical protein JWR26_3463 [Pedosphaera sp.]|nr:hypothetical protein [Pedosphaera sp.]